VIRIDSLFKGNIVPLERHLSAKEMTMTDTREIEVLRKIRSILAEAPEVNVSAVSKVGAGTNVALCCGCVCVDYCLANGSEAMINLVGLFEQKGVATPTDLRGIIEATRLK
jgi:hypothetical protein